MMKIIVLVLCLAATQLEAKVVRDERLDHAKLFDLVVREGRLNTQCIEAELPALMQLAQIVFEQLLLCGKDVHGIIAKQFLVMVGEVKASLTRVIGYLDTLENCDGFPCRFRVYNDMVTEAMYMSNTLLNWFSQSISMVEGELPEMMECMSPIHEEVMERLLEILKNIVQCIMS